MQPPPATTTTNDPAPASGEHSGPLGAGESPPRNYRPTPANAICNPESEARRRGRVGWASAEGHGLRKLRALALRGEVNEVLVRLAATVERNAERSFPPASPRASHTRPRRSPIARNRSRRPRPRTPKPRHPRRRRGRLPPWLHRGAA